MEYTGHTDAWSSNCQMGCPGTLYTKTELEQLHFLICHPSQQQLPDLLKRGIPERPKDDTPKLIKDIIDKCEGCKRFGTRPYRFRVLLPNDESIFNHEVATDVFWVHGNPVLHIVDAHTNYQNVDLPKRLSAGDRWDAFFVAMANVFPASNTTVSASKENLCSYQSFGMMSLLLMILT